jgi:hypothetical protein
MRQPIRQAIATAMETPFQKRLDKDIAHGRITVQQGLVLGMTEAFIRDNPDGRFAELLIALIQGEA